MPLQLQIASPCREKWESMTGDDRVRHCAKCQMNVFNIASMSEPEVRAMLEATTGRVCGRIFRRADGTVLTKDCPVGVSMLRRRLAMVVAASIALVLGVFGWRARSPRCATEPASRSFAGAVRARVETWEASLRTTRTFGPLIEWIDPAPVAIAGDIAMPLPPPPAGK